MFVIAAKNYQMWVTIPETNIFAPENWWLGDDPFLFGFRPIFIGKQLGLGRGTRTHHTDSLAYSMQPLLPSTIHCQAAPRKNITFPQVGKRLFPTNTQLIDVFCWLDTCCAHFPTRLVSFWRCILLKVVWFISFKLENTSIAANIPIIPKPEFLERIPLQTTIWGDGFWVCYDFPVVSTSSHSSEDLRWLTAVCQNGRSSSPVPDTLPDLEEFKRKYYWDVLLVLSKWNITPI